MLQYDGNSLQLEGEEKFWIEPLKILLYMSLLSC
jgi:hypothetical protein